MDILSLTFLVCQGVIGFSGLILGGIIIWLLLTDLIEKNRDRLEPMEYALVIAFVIFVLAVAFYQFTLFIYNLQIM